MIELWLPYPKNSDYLVSTLGRIRRTKTEYTRMWKGKLITAPLPPSKQFKACNKTTRKGYLRANIGGTIRQLHRVVAETWLDNLENKPQVNHIDGNKLNNAVLNLEWVTNQENRDHAVATGLQARGSTVSKKLTELDVQAIREKLAVGLTQLAIADMFGICQQTVSNIVLRKTWTHV